jgi:hypothetical protein
MSENYHTFCAAFVIGILLGLLFYPLHSRGQDIHQHEGQSEIVNQFYSTWMIPGTRTMGCCNKIDCYQAQVRREGGTWFVLQRETHIWRPIPENIIEQNQPDPRESPDGVAHVCMQASQETPRIFCFTHGGGA